ncbi:alpha/beta fold hydrolase [Streptomyces sp. NPDC001714]|uniref:alpha/beta fold hydrolase n=1 Tax=Streptomyces sp. NPDC001714 TaxID=3364603 RepID=UPI0036C89902
MALKAGEDGMSAPDYEYASRLVEIPYGRLHVRDIGGTGLPIVAMHGFPDDSRIYDRIIPLVAPRRVVALDFSGFGKSERGQETTLRPGQREAELGAVLTELGIDRCVLVGHDASGAVAVNFALDHAESVDRLVLLNCYYGDAPSLQFPELIRLLGDPNFKPLADALMDDPKMREWILAHTQARFGYAVGDPDGVVAASVVPQWFGEGTRPDALVAIRAWTATLFPDLEVQNRRIADGDLAALTVPVTVAFGEDDPYLNPEVAGHIAHQFPHAALHLIKNASHWPQWEQPEQTARLILGDED